MKKLNLKIIVKIQEKYQDTSQSDGLSGLTIKNTSKRREEILLDQIDEADKNDDKKLD